LSLTDDATDGEVSVEAKLTQDHVAPAAMRLSTNAGLKYFID
jgi:hypothetical protein